MTVSNMLIVIPLEVSTRFSRQLPSLLLAHSSTSLAPVSCATFSLSCNTNMNTNHQPPTHPSTRPHAKGRVVDWWTMDGGPEHVIEDKGAALETSCQASVAGSRSGGAERLGSEGSEAAAAAAGGCVGAEEAMFDALYDSSMFKRHALNTVQPTIVHNFSKVQRKYLQLG